MNSKIETDVLIDKWKPVLEHPDLKAIDDPHRKGVTAVLLENQQIYTAAQNSEGGGAHSIRLLGESTPTNSAPGTSPLTGAGAGNIAHVDPVLISLVRRATPNLMAHDIAGVQPMNGPSGLIFAMKSRYDSQTGTEALFNEASTTFSGQFKGTNPRGGVIDAANTAHTGTDPNDRAAGAGYTVGTGLTTAQAESLGTTGNEFNEMAFSIDKINVAAKSRALKADYSVELAQDLQALHGLSAEKELSNILTQEIVNEQNREIIRTVNYTASAGAQLNTTTAGEFNLDTDSNGRWSVEKFKGLMFQIERDANEIAKKTRRGKGNVLITSSDVASALQMAGVLDYNPALATSLQVDDTGNTFAGVLNGRVKVYIDPYFADTVNNYYTIGYKGSHPFDAGIFYCPYVPLQMYRAVGENTFQPRIGFKTRYGMVANPFGTNDGDGEIAFAKKNTYYRIAKVTNLM